jgi:aspartyl-tRNA(Asn)/glutamyl-tRNA(Gln) amidotransferase subunit A
MSELAALSLFDVVAALAAGELSPVELVEQALAAAEARAATGAFVVLDRERARAAARATAPAAVSRGPLHGVPVAVKDLIDIKGLPTRAGSCATDLAPARSDAAIVQRLRAAGAIVIGKTATHELAYGVTTPAVTNPRDPSLTAGGSSGGSAAAVAAGIVPLALGTDTAGSVRIPAVCCGVCGLIPPPGTLPGDGVVALAPSFDTLGPIVREPRDLAVAWAALKNGSAAPARRPALTRTLLVADELLGRIDPSALSAVAAVAERLGLPIAQSTPPPFRFWGEPRAVVIADEALAAHRALGVYPARAAELGDEVREADAAAAARSQGEVDRARTQLTDLSHALRAAIGPGDVLLTPALPIAPPERSQPNRAVAGRLTRLVAPINAAALASAVVPAPPCGVQLIARDVPTLLAAVARL